jgi:hypothetical protein
VFARRANFHRTTAPLALDLIYQQQNDNTDMTTSTRNILRILHWALAILAVLAKAARTAICY